MSCFTFSRWTRFTEVSHTQPENWPIQLFMTMSMQTHGTGNLSMERGGGGRGGRGGDILRDDGHASGRFIFYEDVGRERGVLYEV